MSRLPCFLTLDFIIWWLLKFHKFKENGDSCLPLLNITHTHTHTHTTVLRLCWICPGQPGWAGTRRNIYPLTLIVVINHPNLLFPSTTIHGILHIQSTCSTVFFHNLSPSFLWSTSWPGTLHFILHTFLHTTAVQSFSHWYWVSRYQNGKNQEGKTNLGLLEQEIVSGIGICWAICKSVPQTGNDANIPPLSFLQAGCPSCHPTDSVKALKANSSILKGLWKCKYLSWNGTWKRKLVTCVPVVITIGVFL